ncbi:MAG: ferrous iron transport protein A [Candidatus Omnitrophota bacterium]|nr:MAG: ferrous iron transport protein A [Candidatus Omnitrophota bacterium]
MIVDLTKMKVGESGTVVSLEGGRNFTLRVQSLGVRPGKRITKISAHFWRGPVTVRVGGPNIALGFGMAAKVMVEVDRKRHG